MNEIDYLNLNKIIGSQRQMSDANVLRHFEEMHKERIYTWIELLGENAWKDQLIESIRLEVHRYDEPSRFLSRVWELYVATQLIDNGCDILGYEIDNPKKNKKIDFHISKNSVNFLVECKLWYGDQEAYDRELNVVGDFVEKVSFDHHLLNIKNDSGVQADGFDVPAMIAFCMVNMTCNTTKLGNLMRIPSAEDFDDAGKVAQVERNIHAIWHSSNHFLWWPEKTKERSFVLYHPRESDPGLVSVINEFDLFTDISYIVR